MKESGIAPMLPTYLKDQDFYVGIILSGRKAVGIYVAEWEYLHHCTNLLIHFFHIRQSKRREGYAAAWFGNMMTMVDDINASDKILPYHKIVCAVHEEFTGFQIFLKEMGFLCQSIDKELEQYIFVYPHDDVDHG